MNNTEKDKAVYLQMIQEPIGRMSTTSAIFKGFSATIVAGIVTISYKDVNDVILTLSFVPVFLFFLLDIYYLQLEKLYRYLYEQVRIGNHPVDYSIVLLKDRKCEAKACFWQCIASPSIWPFYFPMMTILVVTLIMHIRGII